MIADLIKLYADANIRVAELERENAALREALVLIANGAESAKGIAKVALGKEAQPWGNDPIMRRHLSEGGTPA